MNILIIEDDLNIRSSLQDLLEIHGHTVLAAADGNEGIRLAETLPSLILCDVAMPDKGGYEVIAAIRSRPEARDIPFIFLTARDTREDQRYGMSLGADDYITKPFTEQEILDAIAARVRRQQPLRERVERLLAERRAVTNAPWAHELMTPLCGILGGLELIEAEAENIGPAELRKLLGLIRVGAERQHSLSNKIVLYYELERLKSLASPPASRSRNVVAAIAAGARQAAQEVRRTDDLKLRCDEGAVGLSDAHLRTAVAELTGNAFRFSLPGQIVSVNGSRFGGRYEIEVIDQGTGMTVEQREQVAAFRQFGRSEREQQGLGIGLAIVRTAAEIAGGKMHLDAGPGDRGVRAILDLPVC